MRRKTVALWLVFALLFSLIAGCGPAQEAPSAPPAESYPPLIPTADPAEPESAIPAPSPVESSPVEPDPVPPESPNAPPATETPIPTEEPMPETPVPTETETPAPTEAPIPTEAPAPTEEPVPTETPLQTETPVPTETPAPQPSADPATPAPEQTVEPTNTPAQRTAEEWLATLSLREMVGQLFIVRPEDLDQALADGSPVSDSAAAMLEQYPVGGVILFGNHVQTPDQLHAFTASLQAASALPLFLAVDEEGGLVARLGNTTALQLPKYPNAATIGATGDPGQALEMGRTIGTYLKEYGLNMDFAPVADVNTNPNNPVIGTRAFSSDPDTAAAMASAMAQGLRESGVIPFFKHFPGHGDTAEDSHSGAAVSHKTLEEMRTCEWIPFAEAGALDGVMVGHITTPNATTDGLPASLSREIVTDVLREELGFRGLVVTDALSMGAVANFYDSATAAVMAFQAGADLLLLPANLPAAFDALLSAVERGEISQARLEESVLRILQCKEAYGILG